MCTYIAETEAASVFWEFVSYLFSDRNSPLVLIYLNVSFSTLFRIFLSYTYLLLFKVIYKSVSCRLIPIWRWSMAQYGIIHLLLSGWCDAEKRTDYYGSLIRWKTPTTYGVSCDTGGEPQGGRCEHRKSADVLALPRLYSSVLLQ